MGEKKRNLSEICNNPLNIRSSKSKWMGQTGELKGFCVFENDAWGYRAATYLLMRYRMKGWDTVREIISHWAPPSENDTAGYIIICAGRAELSDVNKRLETISQYLTLMSVMTQVERGCSADVADISKGINLLVNSNLPRDVRREWLSLRAF